MIASGALANSKSAQHGCLCAAPREPVVHFQPIEARRVNESGGRGLHATVVGSYCGSMNIQQLPRVHHRAQTHMPRVHRKTQARMPRVNSTRHKHGRALSFEQTLGKRVTTRVATVKRLRRHPSSHRSHRSPLAVAPHRLMMGKNHLNGTEIAGAQVQSQPSQYDRASTQGPQTSLMNGSTKKVRCDHVWYHFEFTKAASTQAAQELQVEQDAVGELHRGSRPPRCLDFHMVTVVECFSSFVIIHASRKPLPKATTPGRIRKTNSCWKRFCAPW